MEEKVWEMYGHVKTNSDKFLDEKPDINQTTKSEIKKNLLIAVCIIIIAICAFFLIRLLTPLSPLDGTYYPIGNENICFVLKNKPWNLTGKYIRINNTDYYKD